MAERQSADDHFGRIARDAIRLCVGEAPAQSLRVGRACAAQGLHQVRLAYLRLAVGGGGEHRHHARSAESTRPCVALSPALGHDVDDGRPFTFHPVVLAQSLPVRAGSALPDSCHVELRDRSHPKGCPQFPFDRLRQQSAVGNGQRRRPSEAVVAERIQSAPEQQIALPALLTRSGTTAVPTEHRRHRLDLPRPCARGKALVGAEHAVEKSCRVGTHELPSQAFGRR